MALLRHLGIVSVTCLLLLGSVGLGLARPGGGHSYSGGGSHSYSGGSSHSWGGGGSHSYSGGGRSFSGGGAADGTILVVIIPVVLVFFLVRLALQRQNEPQEVISTRTGRENLLWSRRKVDAALQEFREKEDPAFSQTLFLDFAQLLYVQFHSHRHTAEVLNLRPYLAPNIIQLASPRQGFQPKVEEVIIGSMAITQLSTGGGRVRLAVTFDANYTETIGTTATRWWAQEIWVIGRPEGLQSPAPERMQALCCPSCGSALEVGPSGDCRQCGTVVDPGSLTWTVERIQVTGREAERGMSVGNYLPEQGTNLPTIFDPRLNSNMKLFADWHRIEHPAEYQTLFKEKVVEPIFRAIYAAWNDRSYAGVRPLMSDTLFRSHCYWIEAYKRHKLINRLDAIELQGMHLVKLELDKYYEAATVRIFASALDYTIREDGSPYSGNPRVARRFSEYWTFVRRTGVEADERNYDPARCPNCGAPVDMGMTGVCAHCQSKVTNGDFGWILSRITQDEAYYG